MLVDRVDFRVACFSLVVSISESELLSLTEVTGFFIGFFLVVSDDSSLLSLSELLEESVVLEAELAELTTGLDFGGGFSGLDFSTGFGFSTVRAEAFDRGFCVELFTCDFMAANFEFVPVSDSELFSGENMLFFLFKSAFAAAFIGGGFDAFVVCLSAEGLIVLPPLLVFGCGFAVTEGFGAFFGVTVAVVFGFVGFFRFGTSLLCAWLFGGSSSSSDEYMLFLLIDLFGLTLLCFGFGCDLTSECFEDGFGLLSVLLRTVLTDDADFLGSIATGFFSHSSDVEVSVSLEDEESDPVEDELLVLLSEVEPDELSVELRLPALNTAH